MKPGAGDDPFAEEEPGEENEPESPSPPEQPTTETGENQSSTAGHAATAEQLTELPYKYRRSSVKDDRTQQPMFLQDETEKLIEETVDAVESQFNEDVYKTDVVEAMIVAGGENTSPEAVLRRWGYGMKNR